LVCFVSTWIVSGAATEGRYDIGMLTQIQSDGQGRNSALKAIGALLLGLQTPPITGQVAKSRCKRSGKRNSKTMMDDGAYSRRAGDTAPVDLETVEKLVSERLLARDAGDFKKADALLIQLSDAHSVDVEDLNRQWWVADDIASGYAREVGDTAPVDVAEVKKLLMERASSKAEKDYSKADTLKDKLLDAYGVTVNDRARKWFVGAGVAGGYVRKAGDIAAVDVDAVLKLIKERYLAKQAKDYTKADALESQLVDDHGVTADDKSMEWYVYKK